VRRGRSTTRAQLDAGDPVRRYAVVIEMACDNYSAYAPDLQGGIATGETVAEAEWEFSQAIRFHIEGLKEDGLRPTAEGPRGIRQSPRTRGRLTAGQGRPSTRARPVLQSANRLSFFAKRSP
jgi:predicted RNase H-like HicB family nuclease